MKHLCYLSVFLGLNAVAAYLPRQAHADAIVVNQSMKAPTIAEIFVERERIRVELEIGIVDFEAFKNLLPDELFEKLGDGSQPLKERFGKFFQEDWVIRADDEILVPSLKSIEGRQRSRRDEVTGERLPDSVDVDDAALFVVLEYALEPELPKTLSVAPPTSADSGRASATVGFVLYHEGLAVNDFRYLGLTVTADLDWEDPWYSKFRHPNMKRQYDEPLRGFLYAEPFEVRKEIIARPRDLEQWIDLGLAGKETISASEQQAILDKVGDFLATRCPVTIDGKPANGTLDRVHFVRRTLKQTSVVGADEDLPAVSATIGAIFVYPVTGLPEEAAMEWDLFTERSQEMKGVATDEAGGLPVTVTPDDPLLVWKNYLKNPTLPTLVDLDLPPAPSSRSIPVTGVAALLLALFAWRRGRESISAKRKVALAAVAVLALLMLIPGTWVQVRNPFASEPLPSAEETTELVQGLLQNIYRAFDFREESDVYDTLERSVSGELLTDVYVEVRRALQLESQGGASTKVKEVGVVSADATPLDDAQGLVAKTQWNVLGAVGHWGHIHQRAIAYDAEITIEPVDGVWKVTDLQLLSEERL